ncbi:MAG: hypothetical protein EPN85_07545, partial [Bacteroidetes bacterium]
MNKKRQEPSGTNSKASIRQKLADTVTVSENPNRQGIELQFNAEPSLELQPKLRAMGFRHSKSQTMWYGDNTPQAREFAEKVKEALPSSSEGPELFISPSFEAVKTNVEKREYSYVLITLQDGQIKSYIVFEPSKPKAEVIATNFARQQFGENFFMLAAKPRMHIREAKVLFDEGKIIYPEGQDAPVHKGSVIKGTIPKSPEAKIQQGHKIDLTKEESEVADESDEKKLSDKQSKQRFKRLHTPEEEKEILRQFAEHGFMRPFSAQEAFDKDLPVIDLAFRYVEPMEYFRDHIENLRREKIQELREQIKEMKGERGINEKKNSLKEDIAQLEAELNKAEQLVQDETLIFNDDLFEIILEKAKQKGYSPEGENEISSFRDYVTTNVLDNRAIENYHKDPVTKVVDDLIDEYFRKGEKPTYAGVKGKAFYEALSSALKSKSNAIKSYVINNLKGSRNEAEREKRFKEADELWGYSLKPDSEMDKLIEEGKIPHEILNEIGETKISPSPSTKAIAEDLKSGDTFLPNVLVPAGAKEPFLANNFSIYDMKAIIKNNFPHLLKINEKNLSKASALEMFELVQMAHPTDYGIKVGRSAMLNEWEKRGKEMFEELGYPTDTIYPYINIYLGYESIEPLGEILSDNNKEGNEWWAVAEHCRPIADAQKGLEIINELIDKQKRERQTLVNPKTGKPKLEFKKLAGDIAHTIENLKDSKEVLQHYLANPPEKTVTRAKTQPDPLANEQGVYTEKTAGKNYESI